MKDWWADHYLSSTQPDQWDLLAYATRHPDIAPSTIAHSWSSALRRICEDTAEKEVPRKARAQKLLQRYEKEDSRRLRNWKPSFVNHTEITSSSGFSVNYGHSGSVASPVPSADESNPPQSPNSSPIKPPSGEPLPKRTDSTSKKKRKRNKAGSLESFHTYYASMLTSSKWLLPHSHQYVEDIIYTSLLALPTVGERLEHSWVLNLDDPITESWFTAEDWQHICKHMPTWPAWDPAVAKTLRKFKGVRTPAGLYGSLLEGYVTEEERKEMTVEDVRRRFLGSHWVHSALDNMLPLYENPESFKSVYNLEGWYNSSIWYGLYDKVFQTIKGVHISRGESRSTSSTDRKRAELSSSTIQERGTRKARSHKYDGILRYHDIELGASEHARVYTNEDASKWTSDSLKLIKVLHDMLVRLRVHVPTSELLRQVPVTGLITAGLHYQPVKLHYARGYMCVVARHVRREIPTRLEESEELMAAVLDFWGMRGLVMQAVESLERAREERRGRFWESMEEKTEKEVVEEQPPPPILPWSVMTDDNED